MNRSEGEGTSVSGGNEAFATRTSIPRFPFCHLPYALTSHHDQPVIVPLNEPSIALYLEGRNANRIYAPTPAAG